MSLKAAYAMGLGLLHAGMIITIWRIAKLQDHHKQDPRPPPSSPTSRKQSYPCFYLALNGICTSHVPRRWMESLRPPSAGRCVYRYPNAQRKKYFLRLRFRIAIPLIAMPALLHWLVSQSLFLAVVSEYDVLGRAFRAAKQEKDQNYTVFLLSTFPFQSLIMT